MKKSLTLLLLLLITFDCCFAAKSTEKLPEIPWRAIVESQKGQQLLRWEKDIFVKLFGNYSKTDSLMVVTSISRLNQLIKTIHISMSSHDRGNIEIYFIDSTNVSFYHDVVPIYQNYKSQSSWISSNKLLNFTQILYIKSIPEDSRQNFITNTLAFDLFPHYWFDKSYYNRNLQKGEIQESIFRSIDKNKREKLLQKEMQDFDKELLKTVYSPDFNEKLKIARKQFEQGIVIAGWLKANPFAVLLTIFLLFTITIIVITNKFSNRITNNISGKLLKFNIEVLVPGFFLSILLSFLITISWRLQSFYFSTQGIAGTTLIGAVAILFIGMISINLLRYFEILIQRNTNRKLLRVGFIFLSTGLIPFFAFVAVYINVNYRNRSIHFTAKDFEALSYVLLVCMTLATIRSLISYFIFKEKDLIFENETKLSRLRELKTKAELASLHSRINPHFLYNSLNSIAGLAHEDANKTEYMALSLSKLFRYSINRDQSDWTTFKEEAEMVKIYLDVEKVRFDDRINYFIEIPKDLEDFKIPRFIIQPLVENAVKHGLSKSSEKGEIKVKVSQEGQIILIGVSDNGSAFPKDFVPGFGIQSIYDKLEILYKDKFEMNFINSPEKQVLIKLS